MDFEVLVVTSVYVSQVFSDKTYYFLKSTDYFF